MRLRWSDLWDWRGRIGRAEFAIWGVLLFFLKYGIDWTIAQLLFDRPWRPWRYFLPVHSGSLFNLRAADFPFYITLISVALPFIAIGTVLTVRRLRDAGWPPALVVLFFIPLVNLLFFLVLSLSASKIPMVEVSSVQKSFNWFPESRIGSAIMAVLVNAFIGLIFTRFSVQTLSQYGWGLFVGLPFSVGLTSAMIYSYRRRRTHTECLSVSFASIVTLFLALLIFAYEGVICMMMAFPICLLLALLGGSVGYAVQFHPPGRQAKYSMIVLFLVPLGMSGEKHLLPEAEVHSVTTSIEVAAPAWKVWKNVIAFTEIPPPTEWYFQTGLAYPIRASLDGAGVGAIRHCVFSTGEFIEPIEIWNEPYHLRFSVTKNPPPMEEMTLYAKIHPPHLNNFFVSHRGEFQLIPLGPDRTLLKGTTWYQHHMRPEQYWKVWSDWVIHRIHLRVLRHIEKRSTERS
jgi:uncharacterized membrane protein YhaH (DUF805 family)